MPDAITPPTLTALLAPTSPSPPAGKPVPAPFAALLAGAAAPQADAAEPPARTIDARALADLAPGEADPPPPDPSPAAMPAPSLPPRQERAAPGRNLPATRAAPRPPATAERAPTERPGEAVDTDDGDTAGRQAGAKPVASLLPEPIAIIAAAPQPVSTQPPAADDGSSDATAVPGPKAPPNAPAVLAHANPSPPSLATGEAVAAPLEPARPFIAAENPLATRSSPTVGIPAGGAPPRDGTVAVPATSDPHRAPAAALPVPRAADAAPVPVQAAQMAASLPASAAPTPPARTPLAAAARRVVPAGPRPAPSASPAAPAVAATDRLLRARPNTAFAAEPAAAIDAPVAAPPPAPPVADVAATAAPAAIDTQHRDWRSQMLARIDQFVAADPVPGRETRITLSPDALGEVAVRLRETDRGIEVVLDAAPEARALLAEAAPRLTELAEARGLRLSLQSPGSGNEGGDRPPPPPRQTPDAPIPNRRAAMRADADTPTDERIA